MIKPSFGLMDQVESGMIIGVLDPKLYVTMYPNAVYDIWNKDYKDWHSKPVYYVKLNNPQKSMTLEDVQELNPEKDFWTIQQMYEAMPLVPIVIMPQDAIK